MIETIVRNQTFITNGSYLPHMSRPEQIPVIRHMNSEELDKQIKTLETNTRVLRRLYFIKYRYDGDSVEEAANRVGITKNNGYIWQERWNDGGYDGLIPRFAGGKPPKINEIQKKELKESLESSNDWTTEEVREIIFKKFGVQYTLKQVRIILRKMGMRYAKPYQHDYRRPDNAEEILKKTSNLE